MGDMIKTTFMQMLECTKSPAIDIRKTTNFNIAYDDVLVEFANDTVKVKECLESKGIKPLLTMETPRDVIVATTKWNVYDPENTGKERSQKKKIKYQRWLREYLGGGLNNV